MALAAGVETCHDRRVEAATAHQNKQSPVCQSGVETAGVPLDDRIRDRFRRNPAASPEVFRKEIRGSSRKYGDWGSHGASFRQFSHGSISATPQDGPQIPLFVPFMGNIGDFIEVGRGITPESAVLKISLDSLDLFPYRTCTGFRIPSDQYASPIGWNNQFWRIRGYKPVHGIPPTSSGCFGERKPAVPM